MTANKASGRLLSLRRFLAHVHERLALEFGFVLWDGSRVPEEYPSGAIALRLADEGVIAALLRAPNLETILNLWVAARIDIVNGTLFDLVARRPKIRTKEIPYRIDWKKALDVGWRFLLVPRGGPWPLEEIPDDRPSSGAAENKKNIHFHYDTSNEFNAIFLDPEMGYTCGYFRNWDDDIETAQRNKFDYICRKLRLKPGEHMLDIGCGWGGLMFHAVRNYGVTAYGVTLSEHQHEWVRKKIERLGLADKITIDLKDYSAIEGTAKYDKIAQIEMFEHVGFANQENFYRIVHRALKPDGLYIHQASTRVAKRDDRTFKRRRPEAVALAKFILPGTEYDYIGMTVTSLERYGFEVHDVMNWREHQSLTLRRWCERLYANLEAAEREVGRTTTRIWLTWLAATSIAFERNTAGLFQTLVSKRRRGPSGLPPTRADLYR